MSIILARIDDRLIHGQVTEGWFPQLKPDIVLVVSDEVYSSDWMRDLCLAGLPDSCQGKVTGTEEASRIINELDKDSCASTVLFESPRDAYRVVKNNARLTRINVGGMHSSKGKREILDYIFVDDKDTENLRALQDMGIILDFRDLPENENVDVMSRL